MCFNCDGAPFTNYLSIFVFLIQRFSLDPETITHEQKQTKKTIKTITHGEKELNNTNKKTIKIKAFDWFLKQTQTRAAFGWFSLKRGAGPGGGGGGEGGE